MTIKPVVAPTQKRNTAGGGDADKKESHAHSSHNVAVEQSSSHGQQSGRSAAAHPQCRNVVIDAGHGHGKSPQRRNEVYEELARHRRSPHKGTRTKRREHHDHHHHKRERNEREKHASVVSNTGAVTSKCSSPHVPPVGAGSVGSNSPASGGKSPEHLSGIPVVLGCQSPKSQSTVTQAAANLLKAVEETFSGYNSGDEHLQPKEGATTADEWQRRDEQFAKCMADSGYVLKPVEEDGACLFRAISLQIYGDEEMHDVIRQHTMDYIYKNREYFSHFVTEDINSYIKRKRRKDSHGNHIEVQAMSEIYSRPVEVYCYKPTPINIFNSEQLNNGFAPLRLSYQRNSHYNAIIDPYNATVGVGLGLAGYKPDLQTKEAARLSEQLEIEQTMFEDKLKTTDWEATNEVIEEQIARESYLQWCRENIQKTRVSSAASTSATVTSAEASMASDMEASPSKYAMLHRNSGGGNSNAASTAAAAATLDNSMAAATLGGAACSSSAAALLAEHNSFCLSPKSLGALAHNLKKETATTANEMGFESDDTDLSSTSSIGGVSAGGGGSASPLSMSMRTTSTKKAKKRNGSVRSGTKKRRRAEQQLNAAAGALNISDVAARETSEAPSKKSPKHDSTVIATNVAAAANVRSSTPDADQRPCTSKQSCSPDKPSTAAAAAASTSQKTLSSFYQDLLEASYATEAGLDQLSESEMLQRAIRMSTQDYIEDQKRKYLYGP